MFFSEVKERVSEADKASSPEYLALKSCIDRAMPYIDRGNLQNAKLSFLSDIQKCDELKHITEHPLTWVRIMNAHDSGALIDVMEGFSIMITRSEPEAPSVGGSMHQST